MTHRLQNFFMAIMLAIASLFWAQSFASQNNPVFEKLASGGYQLFEASDFGIFADNPLNALEKIFASPKTAPECCNAPNSTPNFVTDAAGNTIDVNATKNLTSLSPSDVNFQAGRGSPTFDSRAAPNSYANLGNSHAFVYGPDGRALYDVSAGRVKVVVWNTNPNTGQSFPNWGSDSKAFVDNVPQSLLDDLGLN